MCTEEIYMNGENKMIDFEQLKFNEEEPVYLQIVEFVKQNIFNGNGQNGEKMPSRREIAAILEVNPNTVQKAYKILEEEGYIITPPKASSYLNITEELLEQKKKKEQEESLLEFIKKARQNNYSLEECITLLTEYWEKVGKQ